MVVVVVTGQENWAIDGKHERRERGEMSVSGTLLVQAIDGWAVMWGESPRNTFSIGSICLCRLPGLVLQLRNPRLPKACCQMKTSNAPRDVLSVAIARGGLH